MYHLLADTIGTKGFTLGLFCLGVSEICKCYIITSFQPINQFILVIITEHMFLMFLGYSVRAQSSLRHLIEVNNESNRTICEICSKLTIKTPE